MEKRALLGVRTRRPTKRSKKKLLKKVAEYLKSDSYMFAPLISPQPKIFHSSASSSNYWAFVFFFFFQLNFWVYFIIFNVFAGGFFIIFHNGVEFFIYFRSAIQRTHQENQQQKFVEEDWGVSELWFLHVYFIGCSSIN